MPLFVILGFSNPLQLGLYFLFVSSNLVSKQFFFAGLEHISFLLFLFILFYYVCIHSHSSYYLHIWDSVNPGYSTTTSPIFHLCCPCLSVISHISSVYVFVQLFHESFFSSHLITYYFILWDVIV